MAVTTNLSQTQLKLFNPSSNLTCSIITPLNNLNFRLCRPKSVKCSVNLPLKPTTPAGKSLSTVLQNDPKLFYDAVSSELHQLSDDRDDAFTRFKLSLGSPEASLHRRIAELKEAECQVAIEDALYMIISYRFSEIRVSLVPSLSRCLYNGRLEILPSKDWELESIHSPEILELVREHLSVVLGWKPGSSVSVNWSTTQVRRQHLSHMYVGSVLFGYFLMSASLRLRLEHNLPLNLRDACGSHTIKHFGFDELVTSGRTSMSQVSNRMRNKDATLRCYVTGLDTETRNVCSKLKSQEGVELIAKHCEALFGNGEDLILTSLSSMKRLVLEAVAFGCFLWDAEQFISPIYKLKDN
ncbi:hypothetical protein KSS87_020512 [Heliosperma pusillum]|nr:hypothetical protein KSS87_020512 [Heliosperma pusillum]